MAASNTQALGNGTDPAASLANGTWYGRALPDDPENAPFPQVVMNPTFLPNGTLIANDAIEWLSPHGTAHGAWEPTDQGAEGLFIWFNVSPEAPFAGATKIRITATIDPQEPDIMLGTISGVVFPPGSDPLDPLDAGGIPIGVFTIESLKRVTLAASSTQALGNGTDPAASLANGTWYGRALPDDPENAPFPQVVMSPTFLSNGTLIANDAIEWLSPHGTAHGAWEPTDQGAEGLFIWFNVSPEAPFAGATKIRITATIDPQEPDIMLGTISGVVFPPGSDPLDPLDAGGIPIGVFTIESLKRVSLDNSRPTAVESLVTEPLPNMFNLAAAYPNPFNPRTTIRFSLPHTAPVQLELFNMQGQLVRRLFTGQLQAGWFAIEWDGTDNNGRQVGSGVYLFRFLTPAGQISQKAVLLK